MIDIIKTDAKLPTVNAKELKDKYQGRNTSFFR